MMILKTCLKIIACSVSCLLKVIYALNPYDENTYKLCQTNFSCNSQSAIIKPKAKRGDAIVIAGEIERLLLINDDNHLSDRSFNKIQKLFYYKFKKVKKRTIAEREDFIFSFFEILNYKLQQCDIHVNETQDKELFETIVFIRAMRSFDTFLQQNYHNNVLDNIGYTNLMKLIKELVQSCSDEFPMKSFYIETTVYDALYLATKNISLSKKRRKKLFGNFLKPTTDLRNSAAYKTYVWLFY